MLRGSTVEVAAPDDRGEHDNSGRSVAGALISLAHHHGHRSHSTPQDISFDFYVYTMTYQPEFCRENQETFAGCHHPQEDWEDQLTIHGLWPSVSGSPRLSDLSPMIVSHAVFSEHAPLLHAPSCTVLQREDGTWPSHCSDEKFDISLLHNLSADLLQIWPNIKALSSVAPSHNAFWEHGRSE